MVEPLKCKHCDLPQGGKETGGTHGLCPFHMAGEMSEQPGQVPTHVMPIWVAYLAGFYINRWKQP